MSEKLRPQDWISIGAFALILIGVIGGAGAAVYDAFTGPPWRCLAYQEKINLAVPFLGVQETRHMECTDWVRP